MRRGLLLAVRGAAQRRASAHADYRGELRAAWTVCDRAALFYTQTGPSKERTALLTHRWARRVITRHS